MLPGGLHKGNCETTPLKVKTPAEESYATMSIPVLSTFLNTVNPSF
tara:strand:- start:764 stop:901 length:138 start_codon:yes stop_codon:yes gene_type:complete